MVSLKELNKLFEGVMVVENQTGKDKTESAAETAEDIGQAFMGCGCGLTILVFLVPFLYFIFTW